VPYPPTLGHGKAIAAVFLMMSRFEHKLGRRDGTA